MILQLWVTLQGCYDSIFQGILSKESLDWIEAVQKGACELTSQKVYSLLYLPSSESHYGYSQGKEKKDLFFQHCPVKPLSELTFT